MTKKELMQLDVESLQEKVTQAQKNLFNLKMNKVTGQMKDTSQFKKLRRTIAQALTFAHQKQCNNN